MIKELSFILEDINSKTDSHFTGLGLLVCDDTDELPIASLYESSPQLTGSTLQENLLCLSDIKNSHHDGFHVVSSNFEITHVAQYFHPKPVKKLYLDPEKKYGARYYVAQIGSSLPCVYYSAVIGNNYGITIFKNGKIWSQKYD